MIYLRKRPRNDWALESVPEDREVYLGGVVRRRKHDNTYIGKMFLMMVMLSIFFCILSDKVEVSRKVFDKNQTDNNTFEVYVSPPDTGQVDSLPSGFQEQIGSCAGREYLQQIFSTFGIDELDNDVCDSFPSWEEVTSLYGDEPIVFGQETCEQYRAAIQVAQQSEASIEPLIRVTGLYNSGTNAMSHALDLNLKRDKIIERYVMWRKIPNWSYRVPWDKHVRLKYREQFTMTRRLEDKDYVLPIIMIRDPYRWMKSMCKASYEVKWQKSQYHCPNLVPSEDDRVELNLPLNATTFRVLDNRTYDRPLRVDMRQEYKSLADMWSSWNSEYLWDASFPRLFVRFEDLLFHAEKVMEIVSQCAGKKFEKPYRYLAKASKKFGKSSDLFTALMKYGSIKGRSDGMTAADVEYAKMVLPQRLMEMFHYPYINKNETAIAFEEDATRGK